MLRSWKGCLLAASVLLIGAAALVAADNSELQPSPFVKQVMPETAKAGDVITIIGENLDKTRVLEFYLTTGASDFKTPVVEQTATEVKVTVPAGIQSGRLKIMILTTADPPQLLEQPVFITIE